MSNAEAERILNFCILLSSERDFDVLLSKIIDIAMEVTNCDGGTLYLYENNQLQFNVMKTKSLGINKCKGDGPALPPVEMDESMVCAYAAIHRTSMNIKDVKSCKRFNFEGHIRYDAMTGYHTQSMLVIPMVDHKDKLIGVMQLINSMDNAGNVIPFRRDKCVFLKALSSQAGIIVSNMRYIKEIENLMTSIARVFADVVDTRIPYNYYHSRNVFRYVKSFIVYVNEEHQKGNTALFFDEKNANELELAALLHDVGKIMIPTEVINKETRLGSKLEALLDRLQYLKALYEIDYLKKEISEKVYQEKIEQINEICEKVQIINKKAFLQADEIAYVASLASLIYENNGKESPKSIPYITKEELECLEIPRGNLTDKERGMINDHAAYTEKYLEQMDFGSYYGSAPKWAGQHHELLDGTGYPRGLKGDEIEPESRILAIADKYEALTAADRPYKKSMSPEKAFSILQAMVDEGKIDGQLLSLFYQMIMIENREISLYKGDDEA